MSASDWGAVAAVVWFSVSSAIAAIGLVTVLDEFSTPSEDRRAARTIWLCWLWPALAVVLTYRGLRWLWKMADWKKTYEPLGGSKK